MSSDKHESRDKNFQKIEKKLAKIEKLQHKIGARLEQLERAEAASSDKVSHEELVTFLDQFRAGEALGEASLGAWIEVSDQACVKGGLRTIQQREGMHARLLEARMKELGATPSFQIPDGVHEATMKDAGNPDKSDALKIADFCKQFPDIDAALKPIHDMIAKLDDDQETRFLLHTIAQDERSTLEFVQQAHEMLSE
jgi:hypothetical protein